MEYYAAVEKHTLKSLSNMSGPPTSFSRQEKLGYKSQPVQDLVEAELSKEVEAGQRPVFSATTGGGWHHG